MSEKIKEFERALDLAEKTSVNVSPRPTVGAVLMKNGEVIGEGITDSPPGNHAEINAIITSSRDTKGSTLFTTLEPCFHQGDTKPCVDKIIEAKVGKVVIGTIDPNPKVRGKSIEKLQNSGVTVQYTQNKIYKARSQDLIEPFKHYIEYGMPYVTAKIAVSLDGKIATKTGDSKWISSQQSRELVQKMRSRSDAVMIGSKTLQADSPSLNAKNKEQQPKFKVVLSSRPSIPETYETLISKESKILVFCNEAPSNKKKWKNTEFIKISKKNQKLDLIEVLTELGKRECMNLLVEGGGELLGSLIDQNLVNKINMFIAPIFIGGGRSINSVGGSGIKLISEARKLSNIKVSQIDQDIMVSGKFI